jgi:hypothetical protein
MQQPRNNGRARRREEAHIAQGYNAPVKKQVTDSRPDYEHDIATLIRTIQRWKKWGDSDKSLEFLLRRSYRNGAEMYAEAMKVINSPLFEVMNEGSEEENKWGVWKRVYDA